VGPTAGLDAVEKREKSPGSAGNRSPTAQHRIPSLYRLPNVQGVFKKAKSGHNSRNKCEEILILFKTTAK
jgi:hypothetical protein